MTLLIISVWAVAIFLFGFWIGCEWMFHKQRPTFDKAAEAIQVQHDFIQEQADYIEEMGQKFQDLVDEVDKVIAKQEKE